MEDHATRRTAAELFTAWLSEQYDHAVRVEEADGRRDPGSPSHTHSRGRLSMLNNVIQGWEMALRDAEATPPTAELAALRAQVATLTEAARLLSDLQAEYPLLTKQRCEDCAACGEWVMCAEHSFISALHRSTWTTGMIERDSLRRQAATLTQERDDALGYLERQGYRRCDIPACNCPFWHGGYANERLREISETLAEAGIPGGTTVHGGVLTLCQRAEAAEAALARLTAIGQRIVTAYDGYRHSFQPHYYPSLLELIDSDLRAAVVPPAPEEP